MTSPDYGLDGCRYCRPNCDGERKPIVAIGHCATCLPNAPLTPLTAADVVAAAIGAPVAPAPVLSVPARPGRCPVPHRAGPQAPWFPCGNALPEGQERCWVCREGAPGSSIAIGAPARKLDTVGPMDVEGAAK